jgi:hypothetical protein
MRLSDARLRCRQTKLIYLDHRLPPWLIEDSPRDRSNRLLGGDLDIFDAAGRRGNRIAVFTQPIQMKFYSLANRLLRRGQSLTRSNTSREIWDIGGIVATCIFNDNRVAHVRDPYFFSPDCFRILFKVPGAKSSLGLPATVARPGLLGCLNCR